MSRLRDPDEILALVRKASEDQGSLPPVDKWHPDHEGVVDMRIARDGTWYYQGTPIKRPAMVRLFSTILRREGDDYFLLTPVEKLKIDVEDAPFVAVLVDQLEDGDNPRLAFTTNVGATVIADAEHPIRVETDPETGEPAPYLLVRNNLEALIHRNVFYELVDMAQPVSREDGQWLVLESGGEQWPIGKIS